MRRKGRGLSPVALLVLFAAAARAGIIAADLGAAVDCFGRSGAIAAELKASKLLVFIAQRGFGEVLHRGLGGLPLLLVCLGAARLDGFFVVFILVLGERQHRRGSRVHLQEI